MLHDFKLFLPFLASQSIFFFFFCAQVASTRHEVSEVSRAERFLGLNNFWESGEEQGVSWAALRCLRTPHVLQPGCCLHLSSWVYPSTVGKVTHGKNEVQPKPARAPIVLIGVLTEKWVLFLTVSELQEGFAGVG